MNGTFQTGHGSGRNTKAYIRNLSPVADIMYTLKSRLSKIGYFITAETMALQEMYSGILHFSFQIRIRKMYTV